MPEKQFIWSHIDLVGPVPLSFGYTWLMTSIDRTTQYLEAVTLRDVTVQTLTDKYLLQWVAKFGVPGHLT